MFNVYVYGHNYFGFAVKVKLQGNANIERNLIDRIDQVMQQDNENLFFQYFVDKEKNYYLAVMYEALEKKFEVNEKKILEFTIYDWSCKNEESVFYLSTNGMFGIELLKKYDREEDVHFSSDARTFIETGADAALKMIGSESIIVTRGLEIF